MASIVSPKMQFCYHLVRLHYDLDHHEAFDLPLISLIAYIRLAQKCVSIVFNVLKNVKNDNSFERSDFAFKRSDKGMIFCIF